MTALTHRLVLSAAAAIAAGLSVAGDWPQLGGGPTHNAVSPEKNAPIQFQLNTAEDGKPVKPGRGVAWFAELGTVTVIPPVVADGLVWVGTNAREPDGDVPAKNWDGGVLMCFRESDGKLLWRHRTPRLTTGIAQDCPHAALGSVPLVEGDRLWYTNNRHEVVCLDIAPLKTGKGDPRELWKFDMPKELGVFPHLPIMQRGGAASVAGYKDKLYVVTHNGVDESHINIPAPDAPSLVCLEKATGKLVWKDSSPGKHILHVQISSPLVAEVGGRAQVIVGQGDGWLRSFDAATGKLLWKCDLNGKDAVYELGGGGIANYVVAAPILSDGRVYVATGRDAEQSAGPGHLYCIDPTRDGDVSRELEAGPKKGKPNPNSAVVWYTPTEIPADAPRIEVGAKKKRDLLRSRDFYFCRTIASPTAHDGLLYAVDIYGLVYCFDAKTGKLYWADDLKATVWGQPLWADGKVYVGTDAGEVFVYAHGKEKNLLAKIEVEQGVRPGLVFANGTLYVTEESRLWAVRSPK